MPDKDLVHQANSQNPIVLIGVQSIRKGMVTSSSCYEELNEFKLQIEDVIKPYHVHKRNAINYRLIFWLIGLVFINLMFITYFQNTNWFCGLYFFNCSFMRLSLSGICGIFAIAALTLGIHIRAEREAVGQLLRKVKQKITLIYSQQCSKRGLRRFLSLFKACPQIAGVKRAYHDAIEKIHEIKEHTLHLMYHIVQARGLDRTSKEQLLNQALLEMQDRLEAVVRKFDNFSCCK